MEGGLEGMNLWEENGQQLQPPEEEFFALAEKVFGNHLLRETILNHAIHLPNGFLDHGTISSLRSVAKDWNDSVCKVLHKNGEPLFSIFLLETNSLNNVDHPGTYSEFLNRFTNTFKRSSRILGRSPTYKLTLFEDVFHGENYQSLYNFLVGCGEGLVSIELYFPVNGGSMSGIFRNLSFPSLQTAAFTIGKTQFEGGFRESYNVSNFLQSILNGAVALKTLTVVHSAANLYPSSVFENLVLPTSLNSIRLMEGFSSDDLEILLVKNRHPNLTSLTLETFKIAMRAGLLTEIFGNLRRSLKYVSLDPEQLSTIKTVMFRFPRMEKLVTFSTTCNTCQLEAGMRFLETYLPKLRVLSLEGLSSDGLDRWTNGSRLSTVLELRLISGDTKFYLNKETLTRINLAFPNVTKLTLDFDRNSVPGLEYMFTQMTNLVDLEITNDGALEGYKPIYWDSVLTGIPALSIPGLWAARKLWEKLEINNDEDPSIRNLTKLRFLSLRDYSDEQLDIHFLTDLAFQFAFLKMSHLRRLDLYGNFSVSEEMAAKWGMEGRVLNYHRRQM